MHEFKKWETPHKTEGMTEYEKWMLLLEWLDDDNEDMFADELGGVICG